MDDFIKKFELMLVVVLVLLAAVYCFWRYHCLPLQLAAEQRYREAAKEREADQEIRDMILSGGGNPDEVMGYKNGKPVTEFQFLKNSRRANAENKQYELDSYDPAYLARHKQFLPVPPWPGASESAPVPVPPRPRPHPPSPPSEPVSRQEL